MRFFWRQPVYESALDGLFRQLAQDDPALFAQKEAGLKRLWDNAPLNPDDDARDRLSRLPLPTNPYL